MMKSTHLTRLHSTRLETAGLVRPVTARVRASCLVPGGSSRKATGVNSTASEESAVLASTLQYSISHGKKMPPAKDGLALFAYKVNLAWSIFFPPQERNLSPKDEVKKRLRMVLVADRCGMSPASLSEMKSSIIRALEDYVDIDQEDSIDVAISNDPGIGTVYSVNIPVRRVKAEVRFADLLGEGVNQEGVTMEWSPEAYDSDPSARFPLGT